MKLLDDILFLASNNSRARAYLDIMIKNNILPSGAIIINKNNIKSAFAKDHTSLFDNETDIEITLKKYNIQTIKAESSTTNSEEVLNAIQGTKQKFIIFAGNPGNILSAKCFELNKKFIHVHPGKTPEYRGSTVFYYSILKENKIFVTAIFMNEKIDEGEILGEMALNLSEIPFLDKAKIDTCIDPFIRGLLLIKILKEYMVSGSFTSHPQNITTDKPYYIIHPVLKNIAINKTNEWHFSDLI